MLLRNNSNVYRVILKRRERAGEADKFDQRTVHHRGQLYVDDPRPPPGQEGTAHDEADEQQMDHEHKVSPDPVLHLAHRPRSTPSPA